jgi:hypothetical protein
MRRHLTTLASLVAMSTASLGTLVAIPATAGAGTTTPAPTITSVTASRTTVYPVRDDYADYTEITATPGWYPPEPQSESLLEIWNADRTTLMQKIGFSSTTSGSVTYAWDGRSDSGIPVRAGTYATRVVYTDGVGGTSTHDGPDITVVREHLKALGWRMPFTPEATLVASYVHRCSSLRRPARRTWTGSLGLYSNTRCAGGNRMASVVETHHAVTLPKPAKFVAYTNAAIDMTGGAARSKPRSTLSISLYNTKNQWSDPRTYGPALKERRFWLGAPPDGAIHDEASAHPWIYWATFVSGGRRYDVKSYTIALSAKVLVAD